MDTVALLGRLTVSLAAVLGIVWLLARRMRKSGRGGGQGLIDVLGRQQLSRSASIAVVHVGDQALIVGVTDGQVSVL
ncbi:flagellar biosynthetic protein FliO, partial [uncultured Jatrophihabitans sp.]|uniref:flagellar biosynthetic protein FliO n=1 Tax=uncultured Jatrophihabitans sp. TaxID=1610747 RepID=UPI0035CAB69F